MKDADVGSAEHVSSCRVCKSLQVSVVELWKSFWDPVMPLTEFHKPSSSFSDKNRRFTLFSDMVAFQAGSNRSKFPNPKHIRSQRSAQTSSQLSLVSHENTPPRLSHSQCSLQTWSLLHSFHMSMLTDNFLLQNVYVSKPLWQQTGVKLQRSENNSVIWSTYS